MTAVLAEPRPLAPEATSPVPLTRLTLVELRKLGDTRAGMWLLILIGLATVGTSALMLGWAPDEELNFADFFAFGLVPSAVLLPVLGILSVTSEWSQRTALTTFALVPVRSRVLVAKMLAATALAVLGVVATAVVSALATLLVPIATEHGSSWELAGEHLGQVLLVQIAYVLVGLAFGMVLLELRPAGSGGLEQMFLTLTAGDSVKESVR